MEKSRIFYSPELTGYQRFKTREVKIGGVPLGGNNPVRIQSMTTADTMNTEASVAETIRLVESGCDYVRLTAPSIKEAKNLEVIKKELRKRGYDVPLIADIHFTPNAAEFAARVIEKVRVNPGNYADKKKFSKIEYTDSEYNAEIERIRERFSPLVKICKEYGTAMRVGANHGSLSDRIMSRYGDTPFGMVESALEFVRICEELNYHDIVLSMKASNPTVMIEAYRLLVNRMVAEGMNYPLHIGVTEAGDGDEGRIKSAMGIGTLLEDGLGDTIRVSLTEPPEYEAPVAIKLANRYKHREERIENFSPEDYPFSPFEFRKRESAEAAGIGGDNPPKVIADFSGSNLTSPEALSEAGLEYNPVIDKWNYRDNAADIIYIGSGNISFDLPANIKTIRDYSSWRLQEDKTASFPLFTLKEFTTAKEKSFVLNFVRVSAGDLNELTPGKAADFGKVVFVAAASAETAFKDFRKIFIHLEENGFRNPVLLKAEYGSLSEEEFMLYAASDLGGMFADGLGDGVWTVYEGKKDLINRTLFNILQAARARITKTEYIACPSCGRTLFDLVEVTNKIRSRTGHLKGVKIGIMGCIVNGPGEMADADYGYVGSGVGKITLYRGQEVVKRNVVSEKAVDELIDIIRNDGRWIDN